jgi:hypothetical protein
MEIAEVGSWAVMVAIVIALTEVIKRVIPNMDQRWLPLFAIAFGLAWTFGLRFGGDLFITAAMGIAVGLASIGLFSGVRAVSGR